MSPENEIKTQFEKTLFDTNGPWHAHLHVSLRLEQQQCLYIKLMHIAEKVYYIFGIIYLKN